jgi:hypothetical protein
LKKNLKKLVKKYPSLIEEIEELQTSLLQNPLQGVSLGNDYFKIRLAIASKNKGKSGGARIITCIKIIEENIYLLSIYDKSEQENIANKTLKQLLEDYELL